MWPLSNDRSPSSTCGVVMFGFCSTGRSEIDSRIFGGVHHPKCVSDPAPETTTFFWLVGRPSKERLGAGTMRSSPAKCIPCFSFLVGCHHRVDAPAMQL